MAKIKKIKHKTKKSVSKRVKVSATGKLKRRATNISHLSGNKTTKQKRHLRKGGYIAKSSAKRLKYTLQGN